MGTPDQRHHSFKLLIKHLTVRCCFAFSVSLLDMYGSPMHKVLSSRRCLRQLSDLHQHSLLSCLPFCCRPRNEAPPKLSQPFKETQTSFQTENANTDICPLPTTTTRGADTHTGQTSDWPCTSSSADPANLGKCWWSAKPWSAPILAASLRGTLLRNTFASFSATGEPSTGLVVPPSDPTPSDPTPGKGQSGPYSTSGSGKSSPQEPLLGLKKRSSGPVAVAISGGVDSAVAAMVLKEAG